MRKLNYQRIVFHHIPKTAGTTIKAALSPLFPEGTEYKVGFNDWDTGSDRDYIALSPQEKERYRFVHGHMPITLLESAPRDSFVFAFFRNPIDRVTSLYNYYVKTEGHKFNKIIQENGLSLRGFVEDGSCNQVDNGMVRILSRTDHVPFGQCVPEQLHVAIANLERYYSFIGLQERFNESMSILFKVIGATPRDCQSLNVTGRRALGYALDQQTRRSIEAYNQLDAAFFEYVRRRYMTIIHPIKKQTRA